MPVTQVQTWCSEKGLNRQWRRIPWCLWGFAQSGRTEICSREPPQRQKITFNSLIETHKKKRRERIIITEVAWFHSDSKMAEKNATITMFRPTNQRFSLMWYKTENLRHWRSWNQRTFGVYYFNNWWQLFVYQNTWHTTHLIVPAPVCAVQYHCICLFLTCICNTHTHTHTHTHIFESATEIFI